MTSIKSIVTSQDDIVADVVDFLIVRFARFDVEVFEGDVPARLSL